MRLRLSRDAQADLTVILEYIAARSPSGAAKVLAAIDRAFDLITQNPHGAPVTDNPAVRVKLVASYPYKIFYRIGIDAVEVVHIRHTSRRPWRGATSKDV